VSEVKTARRSYHSPLRTDAARRTRQAIVTAAAALFLERGYTATSLRDVATAAGVARPTVTAGFGSKPALLRQILDEAIAGDDEPIPVAQRPWFQPVLQATSPAGVLDAYAAVCTLICRRAARMFDVVHCAAGDSPEIAELWDTLGSNRRTGAGMVVRRAAATGPLRPDMSLERCADSLWVFNGPTPYLELVVQRGWDESDYQNWLATQIRAALL